MMLHFMKARTALVLFALALCLRWWGVGDVRALSGDEGLNVPASQNYIDRGHLTSGYWAHPPVGPLFIQAGIAVLGNGPYGRRFSNVLFGSLSVLLLFLIARQYYADNNLAVLASLFLMFDPLHIAFSRTTHEEIPAVLFFLCAAYFFSRYKNGSEHALLPAGAFIGLSLATRWYFLPALALLACLAILHRYRQGRLRLVHGVYLFSMLAVLPISIYLAAYYPWFSRGYRIPEFLVLVEESLKTLQALALEGFTRQGALENAAHPSRWFLQPIITGFAQPSDGTWSTYFVLMNNPPILMLIIPALCFVLYRAGRDRSMARMLPAVLFLIVYAPFLMSQRPIFIYSLLVVLPLAYLILAQAAVQVIELHPMRHAYRGLAIAIIVWGLYLYPLAANKPVPADLYNPLLSLGKIVRPF